ncbi:MAG: hypothetical protein ACI8RZ_000241 [Myxococcota bacterium]|jgi:hypothetical protein
MSERNLIGARLLKRLEKRSVRRPRMGLSPAFYERFGLADPWLQGSTAPEVREGSGDFVYLSGKPFYQMLRRLGQARLRRQKRLERYASRYGERRPVKAARRLWPGESSSRPRFLSGLLTISDGDMLLPEPTTPTPEVEPEEPGIRTVRGWSGSTARSVSGQAAWLSRPTSPARTAEKPSRSQIIVRKVLAEPRLSVREVPARSQRSRPMERAGHRLQSTASFNHASSDAVEPLRRLVRSSGRPARRLVRLIEEIEALPAPEQVRRVRKVVRSLGGTNRAARVEIERALPDHAASPVTVAAGRMASASRQERRRGLRPVLHSSPMMKAVEPSRPMMQPETAAPTVSRPAAPRAAITSRAATPRGATPRTPQSAPGRRVASRRASATTPRAPDGPAQPRSSHPGSLTQRALTRGLRADDSSTSGSARAEILQRASRPSSVAISASPVRLSGAETASAHAARRLTRRPAPSSSISIESARPVRPVRARARRSLLPTITPQLIEPAPAQTKATPEAASPVRQAAARGRVIEARPGSVLPRVVTRTVSSKRQTITRVVPSAAPAPMQRVLSRQAIGTITARSAIPRSTPPRHAPPRPSALPAARSDRPVRIASTRRLAARMEATTPTAGSLLPRVTRAAPTRQTDPSGAPLTEASPFIKASPLTDASRATTPQLAEKVGAASSEARSTRRMAVYAPAEVLPSSAPLPEVSTSTEGEGTTPPRRASASSWFSGTPATDTRRDETPSKKPRSTTPPAVSTRKPSDAAPSLSVTGGTTRQRRVAAIIAASQRFDSSPLVGYSARQASPTSTRRAVASRGSRPATGRMVAGKTVTGQTASRRTASSRAASSSAQATVEVRVRRRLLSYAPSAPPQVVIVTEESRAPEPAIAPASPALTKSPGFPSIFSPSSTVTPPTTSSATRATASVTRAAGGKQTIRTAASRRSPDRPLERLSSRAQWGREQWGQEEGRPAALTRDIGGRQPHTQSLTRRPRLQTTADGVILAAPRSAEAPFDAAIPAVTGRQSAPRSAEGTPPTPWSRPRFSRSGRIEDGGVVESSYTRPLPTIHRTDGGVFVGERRPSRTASPEQRLPLSWTLEAVEAQSINTALPSWARRSSGELLPRPSSANQGLIAALARASDVEEVVRVIFERSNDPAPRLTRMPSPVIQVIQQLRRESAKVEASSSSAGPAAPSGRQMTAATTRTVRSPRKARSSARVVRGFTGLRPLSTAQGGAGVGDGRVMKLAKRLRDLIHLAEHQGRDTARQGVRMAEDSSSARSEGQSSPTQPEGGGNKRQIDIDALGREVLEEVQRMGELRRERSLDGGGDQDSWW